MQRNAPCFCGLPQKMKHCRDSCLKSSSAKMSPSLKRLLDEEGVLIKSPQQIEKIKQACEVTARILDALCDMAQEGVSLDELDQRACQLHEEENVIPAPLGYGDPPYPKAICTSVNDVICHGIPSSYRLKKGDILNIDVSVIKEGYFGDCSKMVIVGPAQGADLDLCKTTYESLMRSIDKVRPGACLSEIGGVIQKIADRKGYSVVRDFVGHGIGLHFHEGPNVLHCKNSLHLPLQEGMTFTIEPMLNAGKLQHFVDQDQWSIKTIDGKKSAQFEHTIEVTATGSRILTNWKLPSWLQ